jgi:hypothetical protein
MKLPFLILLTACCVTGLSQKIKPIIKIAPLAAADDASVPALQAGFEFALSNRMSWYNEVGIRYRKSVYEIADTSFVKPSGLKLRTEWRIYFKKHFKQIPDVPMQGYYLAASAFSMNESHNSAVQYYYRQDTAQLRKDNFGVSKFVWGVSFLLGRQKAMGKHLMLDYYTGFGMRIRKVTPVHLEYVAIRDRIVESVDLNIQLVRDNNDTNNLSVVAPNFNLGIRLCYRF